MRSGSLESPRAVRVTSMTQQELTSLSPYTNYTITVTATNNAQGNATSETSNPIMATTKIASQYELVRHIQAYAPSCVSVCSVLGPVDPIVGGKSVDEITTSTAVYRLPVVEDRTGPVRFVYQTFENESDMIYIACWDS